MAAGSIVIELLAKTGSFDTDIDRSTKAAEKRFKEMERTISDAGSKIGIAFAGVGAGIVAFSKNVIDGLDAMNDLADAVGASIPNISALEDIAARAGTSFDTVGTALVKFNDVLSKGGEEGSKAARVLQQLGLNAEELRRMDPAAALHETAKALARFTEDGDRARAVQILFGKSTREVAAFLKDLSEQSDLVAKVTKQEAAEAEAFNKQLFSLEKNIKDVARAIVSDYVPALNQLIVKGKDEGLIALFGFDKNFWDTKALAGKAQEMKRALEDLNRVKREFLKGDASQAQVDAAQSTFDAARGRFRQADVGFIKPADDAAFRAMNDSESARLAARTRLAFGPLADKPDKPGKVPREKDPPKFPDDDFDNYMRQLDGQITRLHDLGAEERVLADLAANRIKLSVDPMLRDSQETALLLGARQVDVLKREAEAEKEAWRIALDRQAARTSEYGDAKTWLDALTAAEADRVRILVDDEPSRVLRQQTQDMEALTKALQLGSINAEQFGAAVGRITGTTDQMTRIADDLGHIGGDALRELVRGGTKVEEVFARALHRISDMVLEIGVIEPAIKQLKIAMGADPGKGGDGFDFGKAIFGGLAGAFSGSLGDTFGMSIGGTYGPNTQAGLDNLFSSLSGRAAGGPVSASTPYLIGERGPELFVPRTAGMVVPNSALSGGGNVTIVNQTSAKVGAVHEQRLPNGDRALYLQEAVEAVAASLHDPNSRTSRAFQRNFATRRQR